MTKHEFNRKLEYIYPYFETRSPLLLTHIPIILLFQASLHVTISEPLVLFQQNDGCGLQTLTL